MTVVVNGSDPDIYLTNGVREALGLTGESTRPQSIVQAAQDGYVAATGQWIYVQGMPNAASGPIPITPTTKVGTVSISGNTDIETGSASEFSCVFSGDCIDPVYRWSSSCEHIAIVGPKTNMTVQVSGISASFSHPKCWLLCTVTSATAIDGSGTGEAQITVNDPPVPAKTTAKTTKK